MLTVNRFRLCKCSNLWIPNSLLVHWWLPTWANFLYLWPNTAADISIFVLSHFPLQTVASISSLLTCRPSWCELGLGNLLSLILAKYRSLMSHYLMSCWLQSLLLAADLCMQGKVSTDLVLFQSVRPFDTWLIIFGWENDNSAVIRSFLNKYLNENIFSIWIYW